MRQNDTVMMDRPVEWIRDAHGEILAMASGKRVLNIGAAGNATYYRDHRNDGWLHAELDGVASALTGVDIDPAEVEAAQACGFSIVLGDCQSIAFSELFDLIVLADVLEHVSDPAAALANMIKHLTPSGKIVLTTPNATYLGYVAQAVLRGRVRVYWDHVNLFVPETIQALCDRHDWCLSRTGMFSLADSRTPALKFKSAVATGFGRLFPRLNSAFLCVIERGKSEP